MTPGVTLVLNSLRSGGAEKQLLWIASEIVLFGLPCTVFELSSGDRSERIEGMVRSLGIRGVRFLRAPTRSGPFGGFFRLRRHLFEFRPRIVWTWGLRADSLVFVSRLGLANCKWVMSIRSANKGLGWKASWTRRLLLSQCDAVVSNTLMGIMLAGIGGDRDFRYWVLPNAVALDAGVTAKLPDVPPIKWVLVMLGNIKITTKGYDVAAEMARSLRSSNFPFELRIAGRPDELPALEALCARLEVNDCVRFFGEVSRPEEFLREGHIYMLLSRFEGMPNTLLEALSVGLPVISTEVGDLRGLKAQGAPFTLIPAEDAAAAAAAVESATSEWAQTRAAAERGREWVQAHFSQNGCRAVLRDIVDNLLKP